jgi:hypothetical protein
VLYFFRRGYHSEFLNITRMERSIKEIIDYFPSE